MLNGALAMSVSFLKFRFLTACKLQATILPFQAAHRPRSHKSAKRYSLFGNCYRAKTYPGILNILLSISIAHQ